LKKYDVKATFFLVGKNVEKDPATVQAIVKAGHAVGNHTYSHSELILKTGKGVRSQIQRTELAILNAAGVQTNLFRPPFGIDDPLTFRQSKKMGYLTVKWSVTSKDWSHPGVQRIIDNVVPRVRNGSIILMHDGRKTLGGDQSQTVEALKTILPELKERGFEFVTVPELLRAEESKEWLARASKKDLLF
jgi:peptidoglycan/xylan/chitin deacetylase (PgdA/CDA1 family)